MKPIPLAVAFLFLMSSCGGQKYVSLEKLGLQKPIIEFVDLARGAQTPARDGAGRVAQAIQIRVTLKIRNPNGISIYADKMRAQLRSGTLQLPLDPAYRIVGRNIAAGDTQFLEIEFSALTRASTIVLFPLSVTGRIFFNTEKDRFSVAFVNSFEPGEGEDDDDDESDEEREA